MIICWKIKLIYLFYFNKVSLKTFWPTVVCCNWPSVPVSCWAVQSQLEKSPATRRRRRLSRIFHLSRPTKHAADSARTTRTSGATDRRREAASWSSSCSCSDAITDEHDQTERDDDWWWSHAAAVTFTSDILYWTKAHILITMTF